MNILLNNSEVQSAIVTYLNEIGINTNGKEISAHFKIGRGGNGVSAEVSVEDAPQVEESSTSDGTEGIF